MADVYRFMRAFPQVNFRYYVEPSEPLASGLGILNFENSTSTYPMQMQGRKDGKDIIKLGEGFMFQKVRDWHENQAIRKDYPHLGQFLREHSQTISPTKNQSINLNYKKVTPLLVVQPFLLQLKALPLNLVLIDTTNSLVNLAQHSQII